MLLSQEDINALYANVRAKGEYTKYIAEFLGITVDELNQRSAYVPKPEPTKGRFASREDRITRIMRERYNVPEKLIQQLIDEVSPGMEW